jgi:3-oxoacyl-(acyl-carrier-protein) synthase
VSPPFGYIAGVGIISPLGSGVTATVAALKKGTVHLAALTRFVPPDSPPMPVGEVSVASLPLVQELPLTHQLARAAADQAIASGGSAPDAVVIGSTTGGIIATERMLADGCTDPAAYRHHGVATIAEDLAHRYRCRGPVISVSTACSSGAVAISLALAMIRHGWARRVLTGGVDVICRLTYYGFKSLQLIDPAPARPLDRTRKGMSLAEGAGMLLLTAPDLAPDGTAAAILGAGLSCDAHHPAQPHPEGRGALAAMRTALTDAGLDTDEIDYVNLHGTGTLDNDLAEAIALRSLFSRLPPISSLKGAMGHSLAAAGALEAVISAACIEHGFIPGSVGCTHPDPVLELTPVRKTRHQPIARVLSNSFGFGGNNAAVVIGTAPEASAERTLSSPVLRITGWSALTGSGNGLGPLCQGRPCAGRVPAEALKGAIPPSEMRRLKRLSQMSLMLVESARRCAGTPPPLESVYFGTGWGALSETWDFLLRLQQTDERYCSPTDFIGSVHNAAAGQIALRHGATGANVTTSGGAVSFEQALLSAQLTLKSGTSAVILAADETHPRLTPLLDPAAGAALPAEGGGALWVVADGPETAPAIVLRYLGSADDEAVAAMLVTDLGGPATMNRRYGLILVGIPADDHRIGHRQLNRFLAASKFSRPVVAYRSLTGEFPSASAVAAALAARIVGRGSPVPGLLPDAGKLTPNGVLLVGLGKTVSAMEIRSHEGTAHFGQSA